MHLLHKDQLALLERILNFLNLIWLLSQLVLKIQHLSLKIPELLLLLHPLLPLLLRLIIIPPPLLLAVASAHSDPIRVLRLLLNGLLLNILQLIIVIASCLLVVHWVLLHDLFASSFLCRLGSVGLCLLRQWRRMTVMRWYLRVGTFFLGGLLVLPSGLSLLGVQWGSAVVLWVSVAFTGWAWDWIVGWALGVVVDLVGVAWIVLEASTRVVFLVDGGN